MIPAGISESQDAETPRGEITLRKLKERKMGNTDG